MALRDPHRIAEARARRHALAAWWRAHPAHRALAGRLADLPDDAPAADLLDAAAPLFDDIGWLEALIAAAAAPLRDDPWFEPPFRMLDPARQRGLTLFAERRLRISVRRVPLEEIALHKTGAKTHPSIGFTGTWTATRVLRAGGTILDLWEAPRPGADFIAAQAGRCRHAGRRPLTDGMRFTTDGSRQAWTIGRQTGDLVLLQAIARDPQIHLALEYDAASGALRGASATDGAVERMQIMATLLRLMERREAAPVLAARAGEGPFFQRWHMARELAALDTDAARPVLARFAVGDPHREVRAAAAHALELLGT